MQNGEKSLALPDKQTLPVSLEPVQYQEPICNGRRQIVKFASALMLALPLLPQLLWAESNDTDDSQHDLGTINTFMALSSFLTASNVLDHDMGIQILQQLMQEPWGKEHLQRVLKKSHVQTNGEFDAAMLKSLDKGETWFTGHLLTTWVTGTYFHESGNKVISYKQALMHSAFRDIYPEPYMCASEFAYWQSPPV